MVDDALLVGDVCSSQPCVLQFGPRAADEEEEREEAANEEEEGEEAADEEEEEEGSLTELTTGRHSFTNFVKRRT